MTRRLITDADDDGRLSFRCRICGRLNEAPGLVRLEAVEEVSCACGERWAVRLEYDGHVEISENTWAPRYVHVLQLVTPSFHQFGRYMRRGAPCRS